MPSPLPIPHRIVRAAQIDSIRLKRLVAESRIRSASEMTNPDLTVGYSASASDRETAGFWVVVRAEAVVKDKNLTAPESAIRIAAAVEVKYTLPKDMEPPTDEELQSFADSNGVLNAWPYLREAIQDSSSRMGFPPILLPLYRINRPPADGLSGDAGKSTSAGGGRRRPAIKHK